MNGNEDNDWTKKQAKCDAVYKVLRYLADHRDEAKACVGHDDKAHELFARVGGIKIPDYARVIIFDSGEQALQVGASVILEIPSGQLSGSSDDELKPFVLGNYPYWPPT